MEKKEAMLVVSFGTSHRNTLEENIAAIEKDISANFPGIAFRRAFTSGMIIKKLKERDGLSIDNTAEAMERLCSERFTHVTVQPTHIMNGNEYEKMLSEAEPYRDRIELSFGAPLLTSLEDFRAAASAIMHSIAPAAANEAILFMGHGTEHYANAAYCQFEYFLHDMGANRTFVGTVEGYPRLEEVINRLERHPEIKRLRLYPLMIVAGDHAVKDMAGDEEDSWKTVLSSMGYEVECILQGLGENPGIRRIFAEHALSARGK